MTAADIEPVARALAEAFVDDPHMEWVFRDEAGRPATLERFYSLLIARLWMPRGESHTNEQRGGAALWMQPGAWHLSPFDQLKLTPAMIGALRGAVPRLLKIANFMDRKHPREPAHWYLPMVGVAPAWQGRGYGAALMAPMLDRCDAEGMPAYLEASTPRSRALYERLGFEAREECRYADDGPPMWLMWREPQARAASGAS